MAISVRSRSRDFAALFVLLAGVLASYGAPAQQAVVPLQFSFSDPGARSMGFGGAFVALADDATAAFANPAGLVQLLSPEISIEGRSSRHSTPFTEGGRVEGLPSGFGIDTRPGLTTATSGYDVTSISFLSVAYPAGNWAVAFYRHQYANLEFYSETNGLFGGGSGCCQTYTFDQRATSDLDIVSYGLAAAYRLSDALHVGLALVYYDGSLRASATEFRPDDDSPESIFAPTSYLPERSYLSDRLFLNDTDWALTAGFLWRPAEGWSIGGVYRQGMEASVGSELTAGQAFDPAVLPGQVLSRVTGVPIELPDIFGFGTAYRTPDGRLTLSLQWDRVQYSDIPKSLGLDDQAIDDADQIHVGAEYVFLASAPIVALRLGAWSDPDHQLRATSDDPFARARQPRRDDDVHYSAGLGVAMRRLQIDLAVDIADRVDTVSLSAVYKF